MCLIFHRTQKPYRLTASADIPILKVAIKYPYSKLLYSPYRYAGIDLGVTYKSKLDWPSRSGCSTGGIDETRLSEKFKEGYGKFTRNASFISKGFHAYTDMPINDNYDAIMGGIGICLGDQKVLLKGYIPKGSKYYVNTITGMIVASSMVYTEIIKQ